MLWVRAGRQGWLCAPGAPTPRLTWVAATQLCSITTLLLVHYNQHSQWIITHCIPVRWRDLQGILAPTNSDLLWQEIPGNSVSEGAPAVIKIIRPHQLLKFWNHHRVFDRECTKGILELNVLDLSSKHHRVLVVYQTKDRAGTLEAVGRGGLLRSRHYSSLCCEGWV